MRGSVSDDMANCGATTEQAGSLECRARSCDLLKWGTDSRAKVKVNTISGDVADYVGMRQIMFKLRSERSGLDSGREYLKEKAHAVAWQLRI